MSGEFENIELSMSTSDYSQVIFHNIPETYPTVTDIECSYTVTAGLEPNGRDWVGIYKVGWRSAREYKCFDWSIITKGYEKGQKMDVSIKFAASAMPQDDGEFYQFCYVTNTGHVRGASTPFQFRVPGAEEFVEIEDEEDDILVIKTKTTVLEDKLDKAEKEKEELSKTIEYLEKEKESLLSKLIESEKAMSQLKEENLTVAEIHQNVSENLDEQKVTNAELSLIHNSLKEKITCLNQEKETCVKRLDDSDDYIYSLQRKIKSLVTEKDALTGINKSLEEEKELFKTHFATSEDHMKSYLVEMEDLRKRLRVEEDLSTKLKTEVETIQAQLTEEQEKVGDVQLASEADQLVISDLTEKLHNSEDKLAAVEKCKELMISELSTTRQMLDKLSADLEESKSDAHTYKTQLLRQQDLVSSYTEKINTMQKTIENTDQELKNSATEYNKLKEMQQEMETKEKVQEEGAQFALSMAYETLKQRYDKIRGQKEDAQKQLDDAINRLRQCQEDKDRAVTDMKERLRLGQEQYQDRVVECKRLQKELKRVMRAKKAAKLSETEHNQLQKTPCQVSSGGCQTEISQVQMTSAPEVSGAASADDHLADPMTSDPVMSFGDLTEVVVDNPSLVEQTTAELTAQLSDLGHELEIRQKKKQKYKTMYQEEKEKRAYLERHHYDEAAKKDIMIKRLREQIDESTAGYICQIDRLQSVIDMQALEIDGLRAELIHTNTERQQGPQVPLYPPQAPLPMPPFIPPMPPFVPPMPPFMPPMPPHPIYPPQMPPLDHQYSRPPPGLCGCAPQVTSPPIPPRKCEIPCNVVNMAAYPSRQNGSDPLTGGAAPTNLEPPLRPLPPPLSPQRSPEALVAQVKAINDGTGIPESAGNPIEAGDEEEEERFHDAEENPGASAPPMEPEADIEPPSMKTMCQCPVCSMVFPDTIPQNEIIMHIETHMARVCPMCSQTFDDDFTQAQFQEHVDTHFNEAG